MHSLIPTLPRFFAKTSSFLVTSLLLAAGLLLTPSANAQNSEVTGAIEGKVTSSQNANQPVADATVQIINLETLVPRTTKTRADGTFTSSQLPPGRYKVVVKAPNFKDYESDKAQRVDIQITNRAVPLPISLEPLVATTTPTTPTDPSQPMPSPVPSTSPATTGGTAAPSELAEETNIKSEMNTTDARRGGGYRANEVATLPLGGATLTRSFDELALLLPGVAEPPQTEGGVSGPGVGSGVGSAGQFSVNGMRSRANNFTVDGSDNNDDDIGVRRQGFLALVPQPIESIQEFRVISLLAPAQYGRNFGAQVNAVSKSGGNDFHGTFYGFFNSSQLNARNVFDTNNGSAVTGVTARTTLGATTFTQSVFVDGAPLTVKNQSGGEDSLTFGQAGLAVGGPIKREKVFFFLSYERQVLNATKEESFAVPTVEERGIFRTGATGIYADCLTPLGPGFNITNCTPNNAGNFFPEQGFPTALEGDAVFSFFPFPNNPGGIYGGNTYTERLPASARGNVLSGKYDHNFSLWGKPQTFTARYNFTQDWREIPVTGGALFSSVRPRIRTQNFSSFLNSELSSNMSNVLRVSYGRTRLGFEEIRNPFLLPSQVSANRPFLLNSRFLINNTTTTALGVANTGDVNYFTLGTTECGDLSVLDCALSFGSGGGFTAGIGRIGQIKIAGFSPAGVDVNNFPQNRVNNTYQVADALGYTRGRHAMTFGVDIRRVELNSDLPRNSRTLLTYNGAPESSGVVGGFTGNFVPGLDFAAAGAPSGAFLSLANGVGTGINLRYYEYNLFAQDTWRVRPNLTLSFGLRYEDNTPPRSAGNVIENTFGSAALNDANAVGLKKFVDARDRIFDSDKNNFAPRIGFAWSPNWFGVDRTTVIRGGYGLFYDQILGAVVSQSRNVFPNFITVNTGGFGANGGFDFVAFFNPAYGGISHPGFDPLVAPGTLNNLNPALPLALVLDCFAGNVNGTCNGAFLNSLSITLPDRRLKTPSAHQFGVTFEQQLSSSTLLSVGYAGTRGDHLLRSTTPNLGPNNLVLPVAVFAGGDIGHSFIPEFFAGVFAPGFGRPTANAGPVYIFDSGGTSNYDSLQIQFRGRFQRGLQYQANYTFSRSEDDASDMFDLAGSPALPQNSLTRAGEFADSNFDARHRIAYNLIYDFTEGHRGNAFLRGLQFASTGYFHTGQPFTVNSIFDVNLDGNLTDRINSTAGLIITGDRSQPIALAPGTNPRSLLAAVGSSGAIGRNAFRAGNVLEMDLSVIKRFTLMETRGLSLRMDIFNFINRANYGIPVRFLEAPGFGKATNTVTPGRRVQVGVKIDF